KVFQTGFLDRQVVNGIAGGQLDDRVDRTGQADAETVGDRLDGIDAGQRGPLGGVDLGRRMEGEPAVEHVLEVANALDRLKRTVAQDSHPVADLLDFGEDVR